VGAGRPGAGGGGGDLRRVVERGRCEGAWLRAEG